MKNKISSLILFYPLGGASHAIKKNLHGFGMYSRSSINLANKIYQVGTIADLSPGTTVAPIAQAKRCKADLCLVFYDK